MRTFDERTWLSWLVKVRIIIITFLLGIGLAIIRLTHTNVSEWAFVSVILLWYTVGVFFLLLYSVWEDFALQARIQVISDLALTTAVIYITGGIDTSFNFLYPLVIIVASILLPRWWAYLAAALSFIAFGAILDLSYYQVIRSFSVSRPDLQSVQLVVGVNFFAYMAIAYLASNLSAKLRQVGVELHVKSDELQDLQVMQENILHSMRGGLITTDLEGHINLVNQPGLNFLGRKLSDMLGTHISTVFIDPMPEEDSYPVQDELRAATPDGEKIFGLTVTPLTIHDGEIVGFVYTFADLTDIQISRMVSAASGSEGFSAEAQLFQFDDSTSTDPCPAIDGHDRACRPFARDGLCRSRATMGVGRHQHDARLGGILLAGEEQKARPGWGER